MTTKHYHATSKSRPDHEGHTVTIFDDGSVLCTCEWARNGFGANRLAVPKWCNHVTRAMRGELCEMTPGPITDLGRDVLPPMQCSNCHAYVDYPSPAEDRYGACATCLAIPEGVRP